jgi:hypothetical protein
VDDDGVLVSGGGVVLVPVEPPVPLLVPDDGVLVPVEPPVLGEGVLVPW